METLRPPESQSNPNQENETIFGRTPEQISEMYRDILKWDQLQGGCDGDIEE